MDKVLFDESVKKIATRDRRYKPDGYEFLRAALDFTIQSLRNDELEEHRHVSGPELLEGVVKHALKEYGVMASAILESWGIREGEDVGNMVFNLIEVGAFGRSEEDSPEDFIGVLNLRERLVKPFRPSRAVLLSQSRNDETEPPARGNQPAKPSEI